MASPKDDVFLKVEAVLSQDWIKRSGKDVTTILEEIENLGIEQINFRLGSHVLVGSLDQLARIREHFLGKTKHLPSEKRAPAYADYFAETPQRNDLYKTGPFSVNQEWEGRNEVGADWVEKSSRDRPNSGKEPAAPKDRETPKELMVDNDIWEYIENKKSEELKDVETMFAATLTKSEDDSGVLKISIVPKSKDTMHNEVDLMHETLVGLYQETFMKCVIEKHEVHFSDQEAELMLDYISDKFPAVYAKRCIYNDDFLFIGPPRTAREARQQFQVLAQRMKKGHLKAKVENRTVLDDYAESRGHAGGYGDRYCFNEDAPYNESNHEYTNDFRNVSDDDLVKEENRRVTFAEDEGRVAYPGGDANERLINELSNEEDELKAEDESPRLIPSKDFELPDANLYHDWNRYGKFTDDIKHQSGAASLVYWRYDKKKVELAKRAGSDVEDDDWKKESPADDFRIKNDQRVDEFKHELPNGKLERSYKTLDIPDSAQYVSKTTGSTSLLYDDDEPENEVESPNAAKSQEDVSDQKRRDTPNDYPVLKKDPPIARIDANSIIHQSLEPGFRDEEAASKSLVEFLNNSADEKRGSTESLEKKPQKLRKKFYDSEPKVRIIKQAIPGLTGSDDNPPKEAASEFKVISKPNVKVIGEKSSGKLAAEKATSSKAGKTAQREVFGVPFRVLDDSEERELKEVFKAQRKELKKMKYDSSSSEDDAERGVAELRRGRNDDKGNKKLTHEMIEELMSQGDEASQKLLQSLLEKVTNDAGGDDVPIDNAKVENAMVDEATPGAGKIKAEVQAAEKPAAARRRAKSKNASAVPQPPEGIIGCVIDKAFHLPGHDKSGTIEINISFEAGDQADDQVDPGRPYKAMTLKAFLPASGDGRETLRLMKAAFAARKLFMLEEKTDEDIIVPNGITFKDNIDMYPDPDYLPKVIEQLRLLTGQQDK